MLKSLLTARGAAISGIFLFFVISIGWLVFIRAKFDAAAIEGALTVGGIFGTIVTLVILLFPPMPKPIRVHTLLRQGSEFNDAFLIGLEGVFTNNTQAIEHIQIDLDGDSSRQYDIQIRELQKCITNPKVDAVIIRPIRIEDSIRDGILACMAARKLVICVDMFIEPDAIMDSKAIQPYYITSDHRKGGELLGRYVIERMGSAMSNSYVIALLGPNTSPPGTARSMAFVWELILGCFPLGHLGVEVLQDWDRAKAYETFVQAIAKFEQKNLQNVKEIFVFCGADPICMEIDLKINTESFRRKFPGVSDKIMLIGYDGTKTTARDKFNVSRTNHCIATIDVKPEQQGRIVGDVLVRWWKSRELSGVTSNRLMPSLHEIKSSNDTSERQGNLQSQLN
ncbi:MAG: hypothetical protein WAP03_26850 [Methylorubrum rhodinum]|uniref:sugar ABC transporter substrate-binding protein n=1 Tax=Methylorubrum rhodinum TaxID=29428 RepID=UPI003BB168F7